MSKLISEEVLYHHGIKGQKHGIRNYQNLDGSLTPEGRIRYGVGEGRKDDYTLSKGLENHFKNVAGIRKNDNANQKATKIMTHIASTFLPPLQWVNEVNRIEKRMSNDKKLGLKPSFLRSAFTSDMYSVHRANGEGRIKSMFGSIGESFKNVATLGKHVYDIKENYGLEHSNYN